MQVYLVGGAVRDERLGLPVTERDWCVVGSTPEELEALGYRPVGKDFPVFIHPETGEEYALARTERKTAAGYRGFSFNTSPKVTIEDDLERRDLTINAIAVDPEGGFCDPFDGLGDIERRVLRHVSDAFTEDPVRILRVARFAARFHSHGFRVAEDTLDLMRRMVGNGEVDALVPDRVWKETDSALKGNTSRRFFEVLRECGALARIYPEIEALFGVPQPERWHPEIDTGVHTMMVLDQAEALSASPAVRFAALVHDLGKADTPAEQLPSHPGHEKKSASRIRALCERYPVPKAYRDLAVIVAEYHTHCHKALELRPGTVLKVLEKADAFRRPDRFEEFLLTCEADARGRLGLETRDYPQADYLRGALTAASGVDAAQIAAEAALPAAIPRAIHDARLKALRAYKASCSPAP